MDKQYGKLAAWLIDDRNRAEQWRAAAVDHPRLEASYAGRVDAYNLVLAYVAGLTGFRDRASLEASLADDGAKA